MSSGLAGKFQLASELPSPALAESQTSSVLIIKRAGKLEALSIRDLACALGHASGDIGSNQSETLRHSWSLSDFIDRAKDVQGVA